MNIEMNLKKKYFYLLKSGTKDIEVRLLDKKRSTIKIGDIINFRYKENIISTIVINLKHYDNFNDLLTNISPTRIGLSSLKKEALKELSTYYPQDKQDKYKALAIEVKKISD